jgi:hypothetical protein
MWTPYVRVRQSEQLLHGVASPMREIVPMSAGRDCEATNRPYHLRLDSKDWHDMTLVSCDPTGQLSRLQLESAYRRQSAIVIRATTMRVAWRSDEIGEQRVN